MFSSMQPSGGSCSSCWVATAQDRVGGDTSPCQAGFMLGETLGEKPRAHTRIRFPSSPPPTTATTCLYATCDTRWYVYFVCMPYCMLRPTRTLTLLSTCTCSYLHLHLHHPSGHEVAIGTAVDLEKSSSYDVMLKIRTYISTQ
jgi:hypothetical protein